MPNLKQSSVRRWNKDISERKSEIPGKFRNVMQMKDGDKLDHHMRNEGIQTNRTAISKYNKKGRVTGLVTQSVECLLRNVTKGKIGYNRRKDEKKTYAATG